MYVEHRPVVVEVGAGLNDERVRDAMFRQGREESLGAGAQIAHVDATARWMQVGVALRPVSMEMTVDHERNQ